MAEPIRTDEPVDRLFSRPVAGLLVKVLAPTPISANQVTGISAFFGVCVGVALGFQQGLIAAGCVLAYLAFDCADGQLARVRGGGGYLGRAMDGFGDYITAVAIHVGMALWIGDLHGSWLAGWCLSALAGAGMAWASFQLDRYKRRYGGTGDDLVVLRAEAEATPGIKGWMISTLEPYALKLDAGALIPDLEAYQARMRWPTILWLSNGPTMHCAAMTVCFALGRPDIYAAIAAAPMMLLTLLTLWVQHRAEAREPSVVEHPTG
jgi:phosphatidylglycerophosphate synthase